LELILFPKTLHWEVQWLDYNYGILRDKKGLEVSYQIMLEVASEH
jgi:hypothetical protein